MKRTKVLVTIGPASAKREIIEGMVKAGANAFRINMSHGAPEQWRSFIELIRSVTTDVPIVMDTKGPELRLLHVSGEMKIVAGQQFTFSIVERNDMPSISHPITLSQGQVILFDDGAVTARVQSIEQELVHCISYSDGVLTDKRKVTVPNSTINLPIIDAQDRADLEFCMEMNVDAIALSFTQTAKNVHEVRALTNNKFFIIAKIENAGGVQEAVDILHAADGIMVARGDLGVEIPLEDVPLVQKRIIRHCNNAGKPVIVATQMLESMVQVNRPTRAEVSDVANAIMDGADCIMLSGETAKGRYPLESVQTMSKIAERIDSTMRATLNRTEMKFTVAEAISTAVYDLSVNLKVDAIVTATSSGFTARMVARFRPHVLLIAVAHDERIKRQLQFTWGVIPCTFLDDDVIAHKTILKAVKSAIEHHLLKESDLIITTAGVDTRKLGSTNLIEVHYVSDLLAYHENHDH
jgi:pyruvate kinase